MRASATISSLCLVIACAGAEPLAPPADDRPASPARPAASLLLRGGVVHTQVPGQAPATAVAVRDGRVLAAGADRELEAWIGPETQVVELDGRAVLPGLADGHMHLAGLGARDFVLDLRGTRSAAEVAAKVEAAARAAAPGAWVVGRGWDQNDWVPPGKRASFPSARDLDRASPEHPVFLTRVDGHAAWVNSRALAAASVGPKTKDPSGGRLLRDARGHPTGVLIDNAIDLVRAKLPPPTAEDLRRALLAGQAHCLAAGLTQVHDMGQSPMVVEALRQLDEAGELRLRVYGLLDGSHPELAAQLAKGPRLPGADRRYTLRGVKLFADGALGSRGAALFEPYQDDPKNLGLLLTPPEVLEERIRMSRDAGFQTAVHAIGDRAGALVLDLYERVYAGDTATLRPRVEHAQVLRLQDIERLGRAQVVASIQPTHATSDMPWAEARVGPERILGAYAWQKLLRAGATLAAGSDAPVESISVIEGLYAAIHRRDARQAPEGGWYPAEALSPTQAVEAFSAGNAWASFREHEAGRVAPGFVADLTVLSADPYTATPAELLAARVELTIIGGDIAWARVSE